MDAAVAGASGMMIAKTASPMATPANPPGARRSTAPKTTRVRMKVPTASAKNAWPAPTPVPYAAMPRPRSTAFLPSTPTIARAPSTAPASWAAR